MGVVSSDVVHQQASARQLGSACFGVKTGVYIRLLGVADLRRLANIWQERFADPDRELPLSIFKGAGELDLGIVEETLETQFS